MAAVIASLGLAAAASYAADKAKVMVLLAPGFETGETAEILDVVKRGGFHVDSVSIADELVPSQEKIIIKADKVMGKDLAPYKEYDMIVMPGRAITVTM